MEPLVSVVIPTYNRADTIARAIRSVLCQNYQDFELIIVDDGSTDYTKEIVEDFDDSRIFYFAHSLNQGGSSARNTGIKNAQGEYIAFLDSDDEWLQGKLRKQIKLFNSVKNQVGAIYTGFRKIREKGKPIKLVLPKHSGNIYKPLLSGNVVGTTSTVVVKKECFEKVGLFDEKLPSGQDRDMWLRIAKDFQFEYIAEPLVNYYVHEQKISENLKKRFLGVKRLCEKYKGESPLPELLKPTYYYYLGRYLFSQGEMEKGRKIFLKSLKKHRSVANLARFFSSFFEKSVYEMVENKITELS